VNKDDSFDRLLKETLRPGPTPAPGNVCLDAETLAAWSDGSLSRREREAAEVHVADCERCLSMLATLVRTLPAEPAKSAWSRWFTIRWVVPLTAATTAAVLWIAVQPEAPQSGQQAAVQLDSSVPAPPPPPPGARPSAEAARDVTPQSARTSNAQPAPRPTGMPAESKAEARLDANALNRVSDSAAGPATLREKDTDKSRQEAAGSRAAMSPPVPLPDAPARERASEAPPSAPAAAPPPGGVAGETRRFSQVLARAPIEIASSDAQVRWRINGAVVERSTDRGLTWQTQATGVLTPLTAGSSPSPGVCWLVGRNGVVLLTTDGETWRTLPSPEAIDLVAVTALDGSRATVATSAGRTYRTQDAGRTWILQEFPVAPF
jgi:Photosynthesis system II assembly factor YCF48